MPDPADPAGHSRGAENLMRGAVGATVALLVSLGWLMTTPLTADGKALALTIGTATIAMLLMVAGHVRVLADRNSTDRRIAVEMVRAGVREDMGKLLEMVRAEVRGDVAAMLDSMTEKLAQLALDLIVAEREAREKADAQLEDAVDRLYYMVEVQGQSHREQLRDLQWELAAAREEGRQQRQALAMQIGDAYRTPQLRPRRRQRSASQQSEGQQSAAGPTNVVRLPPAETREALGRLQRKINGDSHGDTSSHGNG